MLTPESEHRVPLTNSQVEGLRRDIMDKIDACLAHPKKCTDVSRWASYKLSSITLTSSEVLLDSALRALSFPADTPRQEFELLQAALSGKSEYPISFRWIPPEQE